MQESKLGVEAVGKTCLVEVTYLDEGGGVREAVEYYGEITAVGSSGIVQFRVANRGAPEGKEFSVPPGLRRGKLGIYTLRNGEFVENPDYLGSWTVFSPGEQGDAEGDG